MIKPIILIRICLRDVADQYIYALNRETFNELGVGMSDYICHIETHQKGTIRYCILLLLILCMLILILDGAHVSDSTMILFLF